MTNWLVTHWLNIFVPFLTFISVGALGFWARLIVHAILKRRNSKWFQDGFLIETVWHPFFHWFLLLAAYVAIQVSILSQIVKRLAGEGLASIFVLSLIWTAINLVERFVRYFLGKTKTMQSVISIVSSIARIVIIVTGILVVMEIWGAPTVPIIIVLSACFIIVGIAFRTSLDNIFAGIEIVYSEYIKVGQLVKLESGEAGWVTKISWTRTIIRSTEGNLIIIPNCKLMTNTIINYSTDAAVDVPTRTAAVRPTKLLDILSDREREVLILVSKGASNQEIAQELIISEHTVKSHLRAILSKLNVRNRQQAAVYAAREGLDLGAVTRGKDS